MVHQVGFWYQVLGLGIPETVTMAGANYRSPKMEVPDTMSVCMNHSQKILFLWNSTFNNAYYGEGHDFLFGTKGTVVHDEADRVAYVPQGRRPASAGKEPGSAEGAAQPAGYRDWTGKHMQNFFDCVRSRQQPVCPFEMGFRSAIACQMAIASYRRQRTVRWDPQAEDIV
jgi:predicted dehydrogenase